MKQMWKRLKSKTGETLVETMAAILIFTFGSIIMLSMITSAATINKMAEEADAQYLADMQAVEKADNPRQGGEYFVVFAATEAGLASSLDIVPVDVYGGSQDGLYAYYVKGGS